MLLSTTCPGCGTSGAAPCPDCVASLVPPPALPPPPGVDECRALFAYDGPGRALVTRLKYRNHRDGLPALARAAAALVDAGEVDVVTWAPTTPARRRRRGYDQAELLARRVARHLRRPCRRLLRRRSGGAQTGRSRAERWHGPDLAPGWWHDPRGQRVLVVDDVVTTGATVTAAARVLRQRGASRVIVLALARTSSSRPRTVTKQER